MPYDRIDVSAIPPLPRGTRLVLYGAGDGTVQFLEWLANHAPGCLVLGVADDQPALHGRSLHGLPILPAEALLHMPLDLVVVTTAAGRDAAAERLTALGWSEGAGFVLAGVGHGLRAGGRGARASNPGTGRVKRGKRKGGYEKS